MQRLDNYNKGLIYTEIKGCIDCNKCIHECPILKSNVSVLDGDGSYKVCVDERECILCGICMDTCVHDVRHYRDDCIDFFSELKQGKEFSVLVAPAFYLNYPDEYKYMLGYLRSLGVKNFYPVGLGADIATWAYINYIDKNKTTGNVASPCPAVVYHIEKHLPELLESLIPVQSPMMCTAIYLKRYLGVTEDLAFLSPCVAKKVEIESKRGLGLVEHNITFRSLMEYIKKQRIDLSAYPAVEDDATYGMGAMFSNPGGLSENVEYYLGREASIIQVEGERRAYEYLKFFAARAKRGKELPVLVDILNCEKGCSFGTGTEFRRTNDDEVALETIKLRRKKLYVLSDGNYDVHLNPGQRLAKLNEKFKNLRLEDFMCGYDSNAALHTRIVSKEEVDAIYRQSLLKVTIEDKRIDCAACGYKTCRQMAEAIAHGINHRGNCVYYVKSTLTKSMDEIRAAEEMLRTIIDNMPFVCNIGNRDLQIIECNEEAVKLFGLRDKEEFLQKFELLSPPFQPDGSPSLKRVRELNEEAFITGHNHYEWMHQKLDGELIPCEVTLIRIKRYDEDLVLAFLRDLREFYKNQENTRMLEQRLKAMLDASPILCAIYDEDFKVVEANQATADLFGLEDKSYYAERIFDLCPEYQPDGTPTRDKMLQLLKLAFETGHAQFEWMHQTLDGVPIPCEVHLKRINIGEKDVAISYVRDLREQKDMFAKLETALDREQTASRAKSIFLSNMSHEIRTPMNAIIGMTSIAKKTSDPKRKDYCIDKIDGASKHLLGIINQILDMSRIEAGKYELTFHSFEFKKMISEVASVLSVQIYEKSINLVVDVDEAIPRFIISDELRLAQVITNLLANAVKFTPEGGRVTLRTTLLPDDESRLCVEISDTGIGISLNEQSRLFNAFEQAEAGTSRKFGGTGLGLAISKHIVEMLGGSIWVVSTLGEGAKFVFSIPFEADDIAVCAMSDEEEEAASPKEAERDYTGYTILLAEDVEINRVIVTSLLESTGITIDCAENGVEAIELFTSDPERYDMIFMDLQMPEMDGITATYKIRDLNLQKAKSIPIVAMTANVFQEDIDTCLDAGMNDHLGKPLDYDQMLDMLNRYL